MIDWPFDPGTERYVSLATYRRDGREVRTPVWLVALNQRHYLFSAGQAGKVKRIRANARAQIAACDARGRLCSIWIDASARIVKDPHLMLRVFAALRRKYGWQMWIADVFAQATGRYRARAVIELELGDGIRR